MTHESAEDAMQPAISRLGGLDIVNEVGSMVRVEEWGDGASE